MSDQFVAEIRIFPFNFAPTGWAFCNNQLLPISQNTALFSLLGTNYGGDGKSTFALPGLQGNVAVDQGQGKGLSEYFVGQVGGAPNITLLPTQMPSHQHLANAQTQNATLNDPNGALLATGHYGAAQGGAVNYYFTGNPDTVMSPNAIGPSGGSLPHNNMMNYLTLNYCIAMQGIFPPRT